MSGRRKGLEAEREAVLLLRAHGLRANRVLRARGEAEDVDAVIFLGAPGRCVEVQIKREARPVPPGRVAAIVRPGRVLMERPDRSAWWVTFEPFAGGERLSLPVVLFAERCARGEV